MWNSKSAAWAVCFTIILVGFGACKTKQQTGYLDLHTRILIHESNEGAGKNLVLNVVDKRRHNILLQKDSDRKIKSGRALVTKDFHPSKQLNAEIMNVATEAFQMQGYNTEGKGTGTSRELTIYITKLDLKLRRQKALDDEQEPRFQARLRSKVKITAVNRGKSFGQEYEFFIKKNYSTPPEKLAQEKMLNYGLTQLLYQIQQDKKLNQFLTS